MEEGDVFVVGVLLVVVEVVGDYEDCWGGGGVG